jgi:hypothetical protein
MYASVTTPGITQRCSVLEPRFGLCRMLLMRGSGSAAIEPFAQQNDTCLPPLARQGASQTFHDRSDASTPCELLGAIGHYGQNQRGRGDQPVTQVSTASNQPGLHGHNSTSTPPVNPRTRPGRPPHDHPLALHGGAPFRRTASMHTGSVASPDGSLQR